MLTGGLPGDRGGLRRHPSGAEIGGRRNAFQSKRLCKTSFTGGSAADTLLRLLSGVVAAGLQAVGAVKGLRSGWLLLPAFAAGVMAVVHILRGIGGADVRRVLIPDSWVLWGGVAAYVLLLALTWVFWKRPVTTELFLIVGWPCWRLRDQRPLRLRRSPAWPGSGFCGRSRCRRR